MLLLQKILIFARRTKIIAIIPLIWGAPFKIRRVIISKSGDLLKMRDT